MKNKFQVGDLVEIPNNISFRSGEKFGLVIGYKQYRWETGITILWNTGNIFSIDPRDLRKL